MLYTDLPNKDGVPTSRTKNTVLKLECNTFYSLDYCQKNTVQGHRHRNTTPAPVVHPQTDTVCLGMSKVCAVHGDMLTPRASPLYSTQKRHKSVPRSQTHVWHGPPSFCPSPACVVPAVNRNYLRIKRKLKCSIVIFSCNLGVSECACMAICKVVKWNVMWNIRKLNLYRRKTKLKELKEVRILHANVVCKHMLT